MSLTRDDRISNAVFNCRRGIDSLDAETVELIADGSIEVCPKCGELSAYCWDDCDDYDSEPESGQIAHIGAASCWEWECGHCRTPWMESDSPLNSPCYTHSDD